MSFLQSYILITNHSISRAGKPDPDGLSLRRDIQGDHFHEARPLHALPSASKDVGGSSASGGRKSTYAWKAAGYTECTESCLGGGLYPLFMFFSRDENWRSVFIVL